MNNGILSDEELILHALHLYRDRLIEIGTIFTDAKGLNKEEIEMLEARINKLIDDYTQVD